MENQMSMGDQYLAAIKLIIEDNIGNEKFSVQDLARELGLSRSTLHRKLIRLKGKSATCLITEIRLARAKELIENEVATISEVAYMVGYTSPSYFNKVFKKAYNVSPGEIRKNNSPKRRHQSSSREQGNPVSPRTKRPRFYTIVGTKLLMVFIVAAAAALVAWELIDLVSSSLGLPEQTVNIMIVLLCAGFVIALFLSWVYDLQTDVGLSRTSPRLRNAELVVISNRRKITTYISIGLIVALLIMNLFQNDKEAKGIDLWEKTIAVLPFQNDSPDQDNEHIISGVMESITSSLRRIEELSVISRYSTEQFRDSVLTIPQLASTLKVNYLLMGSLQKYGGQIRLSIKLVDKNDVQLWTEQYDGVINTTEDYYKLQTTIALQVASELHATLRPEEEEIIEKVPTLSIYALGYYRKAREEHIKFWLNNNDTEALGNATGLYGSALEKDPTFGLAYSGLAMAVHNSHRLENRIEREFSKIEEKKVRDSILYLADKALSYDPYLEEAYLVKGSYYYETRDFNRAQEEYDKALQINPNYSWAYNAKADLEFYQKENWIAGLNYKLRAIELERGDVQAELLSELGDLYEMTGFADKAADIYKQTLSMTGDSAKYYYDMGGGRILHAELVPKNFLVQENSQA